MFLTRQAIQSSVSNGDVVIEPYNPANVGPNSVDVTLNTKLMVYDLSVSGCLDVKKPTQCTTLVIPEEGFVLQPGVLYIGATNECATSHRYIPMFEGRSSMGRLGINTHITAGFGDVGWGFEKNPDGSVTCHKPTWTLEITVVHPVRVYAGIRIGQVYFVEPKGEVEWYTGKYGRQQDPQPSESFRDYTKELEDFMENGPEYKHLSLYTTEVVDLYSANKIFQKAKMGDISRYREGELRGFEVHTSQLSYRYIVAGKFC